MTSKPYAGARRVFWIVDNGASHPAGPPPGCLWRSRKRS